MAARAVTATLVATLLCLTLSSNADAALYWGNGDAIDRANLDGSYRSDVPEPPPRFFTGSWIPSTGDACALAVDASHVYWASRRTNAIGRANLDGSNPNDAFISGVDEPCGVAVDSVHIYWTNLGGRTIGRANLDGSGAEPGFIDAGGSRPCGIAADAGHLYWVDEGNASLGRADLNGQEVEQEFVPGAGGGCGVALDGPHIYWASLNTTIGRVGIDGTGVDREFIDGLDRPGGVAVAAGRVYWIEEASIGGQIGRANLDGSGVQRGFLANVGPEGGITADSLTFTPPPPPASNIVLGKVRHNRRTGIAFLSVDTADAGHFKVETGPGVSWIFAGEGYGPALPGGHKLLRLQASGHTFEGRNLRRRLRRRGRAQIKVRIKFSEIMKAEATASRTLMLVRRLPKRR